VEVVCARDGDRLVGVLPFVRGRLWLRSPTNWHSPVFGPVAESAAVHEALFAALLDRRTPLVDMLFIDSEDPALPAWRNASAGARVVERVRMRSPYVPLDSGDFESYRASLGRSLRKELGRMGRRLGETGAVEYEFHDGRGDAGWSRLDSLLDEGFRIEASGWKGESGTAILSRPDTARFYRDVARWAAGRGTLVLAFLRLDGRPLAFDMCIEEAGASNVLKGGFDPEFRRFGPGTLLTAASIERAFKRGLASYELLGSEDDYKLAWTSQVRERIRFQAFPPTASGRVSHLAWTRGRDVAKRAQAEWERRRGPAATP
jgi:CelD/BcsL family acetyltransferase involved in cellulose biosynthesis